MSVPVIAFFNNKGGVGKTTLVYHLAWSCADENMNILAVDLDPQANLTAAFLSEEELEEYWQPGAPKRTIAACIEPLRRGVGDIADPSIERISSHVSLLVGDLNLSRFEDTLSEVWPKCNDGDERAFRVTSAFWRVIQGAAASMQADLVLMDLGPNLGAINRAGLISADLVVTPLAPDLFSLQGLRNLGPRLTDWRKAWQERLAKNPEPSLQLPRGVIRPAGYVVLQHSIRLDRPVRAYEKWIKRIPSEYATSVLGEPEPGITNPANDPNCLKMLKHYRSLIPLAQEARKPIFHLKPADGAIGAHLQAVQSAREDFRDLSFNILGQLEP